MHTRRELNRKYRHLGPSDPDLDEIESGEGLLLLTTVEPLNCICDELEQQLDPGAIDADSTTLYRLIGHTGPRTREDQSALETVAGANQTSFVN